MRGLHFFNLIMTTERRIFIAKTFLTYEQQLQFLETQKNLIISDHTYAEKILEELSYYSLVSGYKSPFKHVSSNKYLPGVTFEELVAFYYFDEELRTLFLKYLLHVERHIKSMFSYSVKNTEKTKPPISTFKITILTKKRNFKSIGLSRLSINPSLFPANIDT